MDSMEDFKSCRKIILLDILYCAFRMLVSHLWLLGLIFIAAIGGIYALARN